MSQEEINIDMEEFFTGWQDEYLAEVEFINYDYLTEGE